MCLAVCSCKDRVAESQIAAQVGNSVLLVSDVRTLVPLGMSGADSAVFVKQYIENWVDEHIMYEQGVKNLPIMEQLNQQAEEYRRMLIAQTYENELLNVRFSSEISEEECETFYQENAKQLRLNQPLVQGVFVKVLKASSKISTVKKWLKELNEDKTDCIEEFDQYGMHLATDYDNFFETWVPMYRLTDKLPVAVADPASFLQRKPYELKDGEYCYLFVIRDFRLAGDVAPYDFIKQDVYDLVVRQRRQSMRQELIEELRSDGIASGFVKMN